jgi:hypothetical protein
LSWLAGRNSDEEQVCQQTTADHNATGYDYGGSLKEPCDNCSNKDATYYVGIKTENLVAGHRLTRPDAFSGRSWFVTLASVTVLVLIGWLDYMTGYEFGFFIFYFIPVAISSWYCGRRLGLQIAFGSALVWYLSDKYTNHPYSHSYFIYWEMFMRLLSFLTTTVTIARIRTMVLNEERMLAELLAVKRQLATVTTQMTAHGAQEDNR